MFLMLAEYFTEGLQQWEFRPPKPEGAPCAHSRQQLTLITDKHLLTWAIRNGIHRPSLSSPWLAESLSTCAHPLAIEMSSFTLSSHPSPIFSWTCLSYLFIESSRYSMIVTPYLSFKYDWNIVLTLKFAFWLFVVYAQNFTFTVFFFWSKMQIFI